MTTILIVFSAVVSAVVVWRWVAEVRGIKRRRELLDRAKAQSEAFWEREGKRASMRDSERIVLDTIRKNPGAR